MCLTIDQKVNSPRQDCAPNIRVAQRDRRSSGQETTEAPDSDNKLGQRSAQNGVERSSLDATRYCRTYCDVTVFLELAATNCVHDKGCLFSKLGRKQPLDLQMSHTLSRYSLLCSVFKQEQTGVSHPYKETNRCSSLTLARGRAVKTSMQTMATGIIYKPKPFFC